MEEFIRFSSFFFERDPAPGYRHSDYGTLYGIGQSGYSWSSSVPATGEYVYRAHNLGFGSSWLAPQTYDRQAAGFQVRCLQE